MLSKKLDTPRRSAGGKWCGRRAEAGRHASGTGGLSSLRPAPLLRCRAGPPVRVQRRCNRSGQQVGVPPAAPVPDRKVHQRGGREAQVFCDLLDGPRCRAGDVVEVGLRWGSRSLFGRFFRLWWGLFSGSGRDVCHGSLLSFFAIVIVCDVVGAIDCQLSTGF